jgi:O-antigen ligase
MTMPSHTRPAFQRRLLDVPIRELLWCFLWFQDGIDTGMVTFFLRGNILLYSAVSIFLVISLGVLAILTAGSRLTFRPKALIILVLLLNVANIVSVFVSPVIFESPVRIYANMITTLTLSLAVMILAQGGDGKILLFSMGRAYVLGTVVTVIAPLLVGGWAELAAPRYGVEGLISPNLIGFSAALGLVFTLGGIGQGAWLIADWGMTVLFSVALIFSFSKTAIIAAVVSLGFVWTSRGGREQLREICIRAAAVAIPLLLLWTRLSGQAAAYLQETSASSTLSGRVPLWDVVIGFSLQRPWFGYGFATSREILRPYSVTWGTDISHAHYAYLTALLQTGYVGAGLLLLIVFVVLRQAGRLIRFREQPVVALWIALLCFVLIHSLTEGAVGAGNFGLALLVALGMIGDRLFGVMGGSEKPA